MTVIDLFAGGGGASTGIEMALGQSPLLAVNHSEHAIAMHKLNHPGTKHLREDVWAIDPWSAVPRHLRNKIRLLWGSPDCTHFSRARGGKPRSKGIRLLPMVMVKWARELRPDVIGMENVREMMSWGPLDGAGRPIKEKQGQTWDTFIGRLELLGYRVEWKVLNCADYGAPTSRKRLFLLARCDNQPIVWPEPSHGPGRTLPYRTAAECIDWSQPCPSIFFTPEQAKAWGKANGVRSPKRPLAENTQRRIAAGIKRYVLESPEPYIVRIGHTSGDGGKVHSIHRPLSTITSKNEHLLVSPYLINTRNGERAGQAPRVRSLLRPMPTITAQGSQGALIAPTLIRYNGDKDGQPRTADITEPLPTVTTEPRFGLVAAFLAKHNGGTTGQGLADPMHTITATDTKALAVAHLTKFYGTSTGSEISSPLPTITGQGGHLGLVAAFLTKYYSAGELQGQLLTEPMHTIPTHDRFGLVTVKIAGESWAIADIGMRMLSPRELARAQGFPDDYQLIGTKTQQVARVGNSVPPQVVAALVRANLGRHQEAA